MPTTLAEKIFQYAAKTAADNSVDLPTGIRMLNDEPADVALELGCTVDEVREWVRAQPETTAKIIAAVLGDDGEHLRTTDGTTVNELCEQAGGRRERDDKADLTAWRFRDGSGIIVSLSAWDLALSPDCMCWAGAGHVERCWSVTAGEASPSNCAPESVDVEVTVRVAGSELHGEVTLTPSEHDGRLVPFGDSVDCWVSRDLLADLRKVTADLDKFRDLLGEIESAAARVVPTAVRQGRIVVNPDALSPAEPDLAVGDRVEGGDIAADHDTGRVLEVNGDTVTVGWDGSGERTSVRTSTLRRRQ